jgi:hypothetical protein
MFDHWSILNACSVLPPMMTMQAASLSNTLATLPAATYTSLNQTISTGQGQVKKIANGTQQTGEPGCGLTDVLMHLPGRFSPTHS